MAWTRDDVPAQHGRHALITGSNTGIGYAAARLLAKKGATVTLACRNADKGRAALARLQAEMPNATLLLLQLDLADLASVRAAAEQLQQRGQAVDILINNAGLMTPPLQRTADGFELQFGTNVLGHFAFTGLIAPLLLQNADVRVVWMSSVAHWDGRIDFANLNAERRYGRWRAYAQSKLADLMLAYEMQRRAQQRGLSLQSLGAHPGGTQSELSRNHALAAALNRIAGRLLQTAEEGAMPAIRAAVDPAARGGEFYGPGGLATMRGPAVRQRSSRRSHDAVVAERLWEACEQLTGVRWWS